MMIDADTDPLPLLRIWHTRCRRHSQPPPENAATAAVLALTIAELERLRGSGQPRRQLKPRSDQSWSPPAPLLPGELERLRGKVGRLQAEHRTLEKIAVGRGRALTR
jgi:hypothetical protein